MNSTKQLNTELKNVTNTPSRIIILISARWCLSNQPFLDWPVKEKCLSRHPDHWQTNTDGTRSPKLFVDNINTGLPSNVCLQLTFVSYLVLSACATETGPRWRWWAGGVVAQKRSRSGRGGEVRTKQKTNLCPSVQPADFFPSRNKPANFSWGERVAGWTQPTENLEEGKQFDWKKFIRPNFEFYTVFSNSLYAG